MRDHHNYAYPHQHAPRSAERVQVRVVGVAEGWDARPKWMSKEFATTTTTTTDPRVRLEIVVSVTDFD